MRIAIRLTALAGAVVVLAVWFFGGPNLGWTKTSVPVPFTDMVTDQQGVRWEKRFLPGVDFLAAGLLAAGLLAGSSFLFRKK